jgi:hypothetical protein
LRVVAPAQAQARARAYLLYPVVRRPRSPSPPLPGTTTALRTATIASTTTTPAVAQPVRPPALARHPTRGETTRCTQPQAHAHPSAPTHPRTPARSHAHARRAAAPAAAADLTLAHPGSPTAHLRSSLRWPARTLCQRLLVGASFPPSEPHPCQPHRCCWRRWSWTRSRSWRRTRQAPSAQRRLRDVA